MPFIKGWKPTPDQLIKMSDSKIGKNPWNKGLKNHPSLRGFHGKHTEETKAKISKNRKGKALGNKNRLGKAPWNKGIPYFVHTEEWRKKVSEATSKEKHWNWKDGISGINASIRNSIQHEEWSIKVKEKDNWTCQTCQKKQCRKIKIIAHHIISFNENPSLRFELSNGITLCRTCHIKIHKPRRNYNSPKPQLL